MKRYFYSSFILLFSLLAAIADAEFTGKGHVHTLSETKQVFLNPDCHATDSCDLKRFTLSKVVNEIWFSDNPDYPTYGNGVIMEYETDSVAALEKYAIVQFKKGCVFETAKTSEGKIRRIITDTVASFGEQVLFCFRQWVIDSQDSDPAYNSDPGYGRFYFLRWNKPGSYDNRTQKYYGAVKPQAPVVYMSDYPAGAFIAGSGIRNVALEFKTCIYKAVDVPSVTRREEIDFAKPINCFEWQNVYVYDFAKAKFQTDLASAPRWEEATPPVNNYRLVLAVGLLIALAIVIFLRLGKRRGQH
ncbi:MAG: hypothetical protein ACXW50_24670 [Candidatus Binatia bacterium]